MNNEPELLRFYQCVFITQFRDEDTGVAFCRASSPDAPGNFCPGFTSNEVRTELTNFIPFVIQDFSQRNDCALVSTASVGQTLCLTFVKVKQTKQLIAIARG